MNLSAVRRVGDVIQIFYQFTDHHHQPSQDSKYDKDMELKIGDGNNHVCVSVKDKHNQIKKTKTPTMPGEVRPPFVR